MLLWRKKLVLTKIESSYAVDPTLTGAANAILTKNANITTFQGNTVELNYDRPYLGNFKSLYTGPHSVLTFDVDLAGSGTAGTTPAYAPLLEACGLEERINAADETDTAVSGSSTTIELATGASTDDDEYNGFLVTIASGTGAGQTRRITDYVGSTLVATVYPEWTTPPDATSVYNVFAQTVFVPRSDTFDSVYMKFFLDGQVHALAGARGTVQATLTREQLPMLQFQFTGLRVAEAAVANPTPDFSAFVEPLPVNKASTPDASVHGYEACCENMVFNLANNVVYRNLINCENVFITDRAPTLQVSIEKPAVGTKNYDGIIAAHTQGPVSVTQGTTSGNIVRLDADRAQLTTPQMSDSDGITLLGMDGRPLPSDAGNDEMFITVY